MGAFLRIVPDEDMRIIHKYLDEGVVLIAQSTLDNMPEDIKAQLEERGDWSEAVEYNFGGGDPDYMVDIIEDGSHFFIQQMEDGSLDFEEAPECGD